METLLLVIALTGSILIGLLIVAKLIVSLVPPFVLLVARIGWALTDGASQMFRQVRTGAASTWQEENAARSYESRIDEIINQAATHGQQGQSSNRSDQNVINASIAIRTMKQLWS